jgi:DNA-binding GntR family transcriptional regulator
VNFYEKFWRPSLPGLPKYAQLRDIFRAAIESGYWKAGDKLPTEVELMKLVPFSLGTIQRALRALTEAGLVVRSQGMGTFVAQERKAIDSPLHLRFLGGDGKSFLPIFPKVLSRTRVKATGPWSRYLGQEGKNIICICRCLDINSEFKVFSKFYINGDRFPSLASQPLSRLANVTLKTLLASQFDLPITHVYQSLSLRKLPNEAIAVIGKGAAGMGLILESVGSMGRSNYVYYIESFIPPTERKLIVSDEYPIAAPLVSAQAVDKKAEAEA